MRLGAEGRAAEVRGRGEARGAVRVAPVGRGVEGQQLEARRWGERGEATRTAEATGERRGSERRTCGDRELDVTEPS